MTSGCNQILDSIRRAVDDRKRRRHEQALNLLTTAYETMQNKIENKKQLIESERESALKTIEHDVENLEIRLKELYKTSVDEASKLQNVLEGARKQAASLATEYEVIVDSYTELIADIRKQEDIEWKQAEQQWLARLREFRNSQEKLQSQYSTAKLNTIVMEAINQDLIV